jgi:hypothetical protein
MKNWRPVPAPFRFAVPLLAALSPLLVVWLWGRLSERAALIDFDMGVYGLGLALFLTLLLAGLLLFLGWDALTIRYTLAGKELRISHGGTVHVIPLETISGVLAPGDVVGGKSVSVRWRGGPVLPGYVVNEGESPQLGAVISVATVPPAGQVFVRTPGAVYGISPGNPSEFVSALKKGMDEAGTPDLDGEIISVRVIRHGAGGWAYRLWSDRAARNLLLVGLALNVLFFGYLALVYGGLPSRIPMHWNSQAQVDRIESSLELLDLPVFALAVWLVNVVAGWWALSRERAATLFLLSGAVATQIVFWAGAASIALRAF